MKNSIVAGLILIGMIGGSVAASESAQAFCIVNAVTGNCVEDEAEPVTNLAEFAIAVGACTGQTLRGDGAWRWTVAGVGDDLPSPLAYPMVWEKKARVCSGQVDSWFCVAKVADGSWIHVDGAPAPYLGEAVGGYKGALVIVGYGACRWDSTTCPSFEGAVLLVIDIIGRCVTS